MASVNLRDKRDLRQEMKLSRTELSHSEILDKSETITRKLFDVPEIIESRSILAYMPVNKEVDIRFLIDKLVDMQKDLFLPFYDQADDCYKIAKFTGWENLQSGKYGIKQPKNANAVSTAVIGLAILPGLAFDVDGTRLGYGKGVYDRLLGKMNAFRVGIAYDFQLLDHVPGEKHDLKMNLVLTEKREIRI